MNELVNRYGITYEQMLHDLAILKMQRMSDLPTDHDDKLITCYYETIADLNDALNHYKETHYF